MLQRIFVDFNTLTSAPVDLVKFTEQPALPPLPRLEIGERVLLYDADGLEVEALLVDFNRDTWLASPDDDTWRDTIPASDPTLSSSHP